MQHVTKMSLRYPKQKPDGTWAVVSFWFEERVALDVEKARNEFLRRYQRPLLVTDGGRTYAQQAALKVAKPRLAATPGKSWHEAGIAMDVDMAHMNQSTGCQANSEAFLAEFGFVRTVSTERWHFENHRYYTRSRGVKGAIAYIGNA